MRLSLLYIILLVSFFGCIEDEPHTGDGYKLFVTLQDSDRVAIVSSDNLALLTHIDIDLSECSNFETQEACMMGGCMWMNMNETCMADNVLMM